MGCSKELIFCVLFAENQPSGVQVLEPLSFSSVSGLTAGRKKRWKNGRRVGCLCLWGAFDEEAILTVAHNGAADPVSSTHTTKLLVKTKNVSQRLTFAKW